MNKKLLFLLCLFQFGEILGKKSEVSRKLDVLRQPSTFCNFLNGMVSVNVSEKCTEHLNEICQHPEVIENLFDAISKFPYTGLITSTRLDFGNFDECLAVDHKYGGGKILGKYCLDGLIIFDLANMSATENAYKLATCIPSGCSAEDYNTIFQTIFGQTFHIPFPGKFIDIFCTTKEDKLEWAAEDYVTTILILICVGLMIISTVYDLYLERANKKSRHPLLLAFSVYTNGRKLLQTSKPVPNSEQIHVFYGLRVISMAWIIAGHGMSQMQSATLINNDFLRNYLSMYYTFYISSADYAVDTFFWISGFLLAYQYLKMKNKPLRSQILEVPMHILHRYIRLTPAALMVFLFTISLFARIGNGPIYHHMAERIQENCRTYWWTFFLYIQNYYNYKTEDLCLVPTWYLSADMQLFLISPCVIIPLAVALRDIKKLKTCMWCLAAFNVGALIITIAIKLHFRDYVNDAETHRRIVLYFIGVMMGAFMRETKSRPFISANLSAKRLSIINLVLWVFTLLGLLGMTLLNKYVELYAGYEYTAIFIPGIKAVWVILLCWVVYSCHYGYGGIINWILTRPIIQVLGKLTYSIYLVHPLVISHYFMVGRTRLYFSDYIAFRQWCGFFITSIIVAFFWTLAFESPLIIIEKIILGRGGRQRKQHSKKRKCSIQNHR